MLHYRHTCIVVDRAGFMLFHPSFVENLNIDESHLTLLVKYSPPFYSKERSEKKQILSESEFEQSYRQIFQIITWWK